MNSSIASLEARLSFISRRVSCPAVSSPGPDSHQLEAILRAACRAPDHGALRPWRFTVLQDKNLKLLSDAYAASVIERDPDAPLETIEQARTKALRAPTVVVLWAQLNPNNPKVPEVEQLLAAGAVGQNLLLAAFHLGFGAIWKTGISAYSKATREILGLPPTAHIIGFFFLGTPSKRLKAVPHVDLQQFLHRPDHAASDL